MKSTLNNDKCTKNDYRQLFAGSAEPLRWLCSTLTGDEQLTDTIQDAALAQSLKDAGQVFREWMMSWARRVVIKTCIQTMRPWQSSLAQEAYQLYPMRLDAIDPGNLARVVNLPREVLQQRLLRLDVLSRFVFVMRALEGYLRRETALLLNIDDRACEWICLRAARNLHQHEEIDSGSQTIEWPLEADWGLAQAGD